MTLAAAPSHRERMADPLRFFPRFLDPVVALCFGGLWMLAEVSRAVPLVPDRGAFTGVWWVVALAAVAIAAARLAPGVALVVIVATPLLQILRVIDPPGSTSWPVYAAVVYVAFMTAGTAPRRTLIPSLIAVVVQASLVAFALTEVGEWRSRTGMMPPRGVMDAVGLVAQMTAFVLAAVLCAWGAGFVLRLVAERRVDKRLLAETVEDLAGAELELDQVRERAQIAQEVHDVLAHSLTVVVAMADGSRFIREQRPETTDAALRDIADAARDAIVDLRGLMEELTDQTVRPQPGMNDVGALLERLRAAGLAVALEEFGTPGGLTATKELAVYRILQEALTNALKHGGRGAQASVSLDWRGPGLALMVRSSAASVVGVANAGDPPSSDVETSRGFGIRGMRDRAHLAGGWLTADVGPEEDGAFLVTASIPTVERSESAGV